MLRRLLAPRWLAGHALVLTAAAVMLLLSRWQLHRARHTGSLQNWAYTVEWVLFAGFTVVAYAKLARDEVTGKGPREPRPSERPLPVVRAAPAAGDDEDPELAAYNRYLADLHERSQA